MKTTLTTLLVAALAGLAPTTSASATDWRTPGSQRCAVIDCSGSRGGDGGGNSGRDDSAARAERQRVYDQAHSEMSAAWTRAAESTSSVDWRETLRLLQRMQSLRDGPVTRDNIARATAELGKAMDRDGQVAARTNESVRLNNLGADAQARGDYDDALALYWKAVEMDPGSAAAVGNVERLASYMRARAESARLATIAMDERNAMVVDARNAHSGLPKAMEEAITGLFPFDPPVSDRVRKGFQAVMTGDWKVARAWFQDAYNHDPGNINVRRFIETVDLSTDERLSRFRSGKVEKKPYATLKANADPVFSGVVGTNVGKNMDSIMQSLDAILLNALCPSCNGN